MKRTVRSLLSMVMVLSMLLSMVLISGLTASAADPVTVPLATDLAPGYNNTNMSATGTDGLGVTLASPWTDATSYGYTYWNFTLAQIAQTPYLVVDIADDSVANIGGYGYLTYGWLGSALADLRSAALQVIDLSAIATDDNVCLCFTLNATVVFDALYLTDTNPNAESGSSAGVPLATLAAGVNNANVSASGADNLGATMAQPWLTSEGYGYTYWNISYAQLLQTPYLVVDIADDSVSSIGGRHDLSNSWTTPVQEIPVVAYRQVINLLSVAESLADPNLLCVCFTFTADVSFDALYLTSEKETVNYYVKDMTVGLTDATTITASDNGVNYANGSYVYYERIPSFRYLVYKLKEGSATPTISICADAWNTNKVILPAASTTQTVVDVQALPNYSAASNMLLQNNYGGNVEFEEYYFTNDAEPNVHYVQMNTNGGSEVPAGFVGTGWQPSLNSTKPGYQLLGWCSDAALTTPVTGVTESGTLYAKWGLINHISPVFGQLQTGVNAASETAAIRFAVAIDTRSFAEAGFVFSLSNANPEVGAANSLVNTTDTVWTSINAAGSAVSAEELHGSYIFACTVNEIGNANFGTTIYARAFVKDFEGNYTYTDVKAYSVTGMLSAAA